MFSTRLNPFIHLDPAEQGPAGKPQAPARPSGPAPQRPRLPRADSCSGNRLQHQLLRQLSQMPSRKPITWQQMCRKNDFFQPLRLPYSYSPSQLLKSLFSTLQHYFQVPAMQPYAQSHAGRPLYPMPQAFALWVMPGTYSSRPPAPPAVSPSSSPRVEVPASGRTSGLSASAFLAKWQDTPFKSKATEIEIPIEYSARSPLGLVSKEGNAGQITTLTEPVSVTIPENLTFSGERHYTLYVNAMIMAHLHDRKAEGYKFGINDFHWHRVPPAPRHAHHAAQAKQLAASILRAEGKDLDRLEAEVAAMSKLNQGLGWLEPTSVSEQISCSAWEAKCAQDANARQDLLQLGASGVESHAVLKNVHASVHLDSVKQAEAEQRKKDKLLVHQDIDRNLEAWVTGALSRNPGNMQAAKREVHEKIRNSCDRHLSGEFWKNREILKGKAIDRIIDTHDDNIAAMMLKLK